MVSLSRDIHSEIFCAGEIYWINPSFYKSFITATANRAGIGFAEFLNLPYP
jgi:hypothetical protein